MKKALAAVLLVAVAIVLIAIGCKRKEESEGKYRIAVIPKGTTHVFWKSIHAGALKAKQELGDSGLEVEIIWVTWGLRQLWPTFTAGRWKKESTPARWWRLHKICMIRR